MKYTIYMVYPVQLKPVTCKCTGNIPVTCARTGITPITCERTGNIPVTCERVGNKLLFYILLDLSLFGFLCQIIFLLVFN